MRNPFKRDDDEETLELADETFNVLCAAQLYAQKSGKEKFDDAHLLMGALAVDCDEAGTLRELLVICGIKWDEVWLYAAATAGLEEEPPTTRHAPSDHGPGQKADLDFTERARAVVIKAEVEAGDFAISPVHVFLACFSTPGDSPLTQTFAPLNIEPMQVRLHLQQLLRAQTEVQELAHHPLMQLAPDGARAISAADAAMRASFCGRISTLHLLIGIVENPDNEAVRMLEQNGVNIGALRTKARAAIANDGQIAGPELRFTPAAKRAIERAKDAAYKNQREKIGALELWQGLQPHRTFWIEIFQFGWNPADPAAKILADLSDDNRPIVTASLPKVPEYLSRPFALFFGGQIVIGLVLRVWVSFGQLFAINIATVAVLYVAVFSLFYTLILALGGALFSKSSSFKKTWALAFIGALLGAVSLYLIALH